MSYACGNDDYCGDQSCSCGAKEAKEKLAARTIAEQMRYFLKRWGYVPIIDIKAAQANLVHFWTPVHL